MANQQLNALVETTSVDSADHLLIQEGAVRAKRVIGSNFKASLESGGGIALGLDTAQISTGTFADARIAESNVTQHEAALSVTESQISDLDKFVQQSFTQASHGFSAGDAIGHNGSSWIKADASAGQTECHAVCTAVADVNNFTASVSGFHTLTSHGFTLGLNYLSETAGAVTTTEPGPPALAQEVLVAIDANTVLLRIGTAIE